MAVSTAETSKKSNNKSFYSTVFVLLFIAKLYIKKFEQFCLSDLLKFILTDYKNSIRCPLDKKRKIS